METREREEPFPKRRKLAPYKQPSLLFIARERAKKEPDNPTWSLLPLELLMKVFGYLDPRDRRAVGSVCHQWRSALNIPALWTDSWIILKPGIKTKPTRFWNMLHQRGYVKFALQGKANIVKDLAVLSEKMMPQLIGLKLILTTRVDLDIVNSITTLEILHLEFQSRFGSAKWLSDFIQFSCFPSLSELTLAGVSDLGMQEYDYLYHPHVHTLVIRNCGSFNARNMRKIVQQFPSLKRLDVLNCTFYDGFVPNAPHPPDHDDTVVIPAIATGVTHLNLSKTVFGLIGSSWPLVFNALRSINLLFCFQESENLTKILSSLPLLEEINIRGNKCTDGVLSSLICKNLRKIDLSVNQDVTMAGLKSLSLLAKQSLRFLYLGYCSGIMIKRDQFIQTLEVLFPSLQHLDLSGWELSDDYVQHVITTNKCLRKLILSSPGSKVTSMIQQRPTPLPMATGLPIDCPRTVIQYIFNGFN